MSASTPSVLPLPAPVELRVRAESETLDDFVREFAAYASLGGLFLRGVEPEPAGSQVRFLVTLRGGAPVLRGRGVVAWSRRRSSPFQTPRTPGVAITLEQTDLATERTIRRIVDAVGGRALLAGPPDPDPQPEAPAYMVQLLAECSAPSRPPQPPVSADWGTGSKPPAIRPLHPDGAAVPNAARGSGPVVYELDLADGLEPLPFQCGPQAAEEVASFELAGFELGSTRDCSDLSAPAVAAPIPLPAPVREEPPAANAALQDASAVARMIRTASDLFEARLRASAEEASHAAAAPRVEQEVTGTAADAAQLTENAAAQLVEQAVTRATVAVAEQVRTALDRAEVSSREATAHLVEQAVTRATAAASELATSATAKMVEQAVTRATAASVEQAVTRATAAASEQVRSATAQLVEQAVTRVTAVAAEQVRTALDRAEVSSREATAQLVEQAVTRATAAAAEQSSARLGEAVKEVGRAVAAPATPARTTRAERLARAIDCARGRDFERAEAELLAAIGEAPDDARLRLELGLVYFDWSGGPGTEHDSAAEACFARAAALDPRSDLPLVHLGNVQRRRSLMRQARASYQAALVQNPGSRAAREGLHLHGALRFRSAAPHLAAAAVFGLVLLLGSQWAFWPVSAVADPARLASTAPPPAPPAALAAAPPRSEPPPLTPPAPAPPPAAAAPVAVASVSERGESEPPRQARQASKPERAEPRPAASTQRELEQLVKKGDSALRAGKVEEALEAYASALKRDGGLAAAHRGIGSVKLMQGRDAEAVTAYRRYLSLAPTASDAGRIRGILEGL